MEKESKNPDKTKKTFLQKLNRAVDLFEVWVLSFGILALALLLMANVFARIFFRPIYYAEEITMILIQIVTFVGVSYGVRKARHIRMGAIFDAVGIKFPKMQKVMIYAISAYSGLIMFIMAYYSYNSLVVTKRTQQATPSLGIPYWTLYIIIVVGFAMAGINYIRTIAKNVVEEDVWISPEQKGEYEDEEIIY